MDEIKRIISTLSNAGYETKTIGISSEIFYSAKIGNRSLAITISYNPKELDEYSEKNITEASINLDGSRINISLYPVKKATINIRIKTYEDGKLLDSQPRADIDKSINTVSELIKELGYVVI